MSSGIALYSQLGFLSKGQEVDYIFTIFATQHENHQLCQVFEQCLTQNKNFPVQASWVTEDSEMFLHEYLIAFICLNAFVGSVWSYSSKGKGN